MRFKVLILLVVLVGVLAGCSSQDTISDLGNDEVYQIPVNEINENIQKFEHDVNGVKVRFFVVKGINGEIKTAFDACDVCGGNKGGYIQQGDDIKCKNCGRVFSIDGLGTKNKGYGCWPSYLGHTIENGQLFISKDEIAAGVHRFA